MHRPVAKQWLCKQRPLLGNARYIHGAKIGKGVFYVVRAATVAMQLHTKDTSTTIEGCVFCVVRSEELS
jgi:hypothetical protein